jgi:phage baseplate assembly protein V
MFEFEITELNRRVANMVRLGRVAAIDYAGSIPKVRVRIEPLTTAWLPLLSLRAGSDKHWWPVEVNEQVLVLSPSGELNQGVVLGSLHQQNFAAPASTIDVHRVTYSDGAVIEYDRAAHHLSATLPSGATTTLISDGGVSIVGDVTVTGNIKASGDITDHTRSMQAGRDRFNAHQHPPGVPLTGVPAQQQ